MKERWTKRELDPPTASPFAPTAVSSTGFANPIHLVAHRASPRPDRRRMTRPPVVRLARLILTPAASSIGPPEGQIVIELGGTRVIVGRGTDLATVATVLSMLGGNS